MTDPALAVVMLSELLPAPIVTIITTRDVDEPLLPAEEGLVASAVESRRREFTTGRSIARLALSRLGGPVGPLLADPRGAPAWPDGVVGSLTHCRGIRATAVARSTDVLGLGLDAEENAPLPDGVLDVVAGPREQRALAALPRLPAAAWDRLLFSAKESVYKVWSPATGEWLDFEEVTVDLDPNGTFTARIHRPGLVLADRPVQMLSGRWTASAHHVVTAITVPA